jgi:hypothetical protein
MEGVNIHLNENTLSCSAFIDKHTLTKEWRMNNDTCDQTMHVLSTMAALSYGKDSRTTDLHVGLTHIRDQSEGGFQQCVR